jgi:hypothetical protein
MLSHHHTGWQREDPYAPTAIEHDEVFPWMRALALPGAPSSLMRASSRALGESGTGIVAVGQLHLPH